MRVVLYTSIGSLQTPLFRYIYAHVSERCDDVHVVVVQPRPSRLSARVKRSWRKLRRLGFLYAIEVLSSLPLQLVLMSADSRLSDQLLEQLPRPQNVLNEARIVRVQGINTPDAVATISSLQPDIILQAGAGILRRKIFELARLGTINMHHGIAPLIKGMNSIYWALWEQRPEWLGVTVHWIDEGIDTGGVLAYARLDPDRLSQRFPELYAEATERGVERLMAVLETAKSERPSEVASAAGAQSYRSTISGWRLAALRLRRAANGTSPPYHKSS